MRDFAARFAIAVVVVSLLMGGAVFAAHAKVTAALGSIKKVKVNVKEIGPGEPANFLLIGSDSRAFVTNAQQAHAFGDPAIQAGQRADSIMIMHLDADAKKVVLMSIPRDTYVTVRGLGRTKINAALNGVPGTSGPDLLIETIKNNFNVEINHYLAVNFDTFSKVVDAIGTVPVYFQYPARDNNNGHNETGLDQRTAGCIRLDGAHALEYVRSRYFQQLINGRWVSDPTSDLGRVTRQRAFLQTVAKQALKQGLGNPLTASKITDRLLPNLTSDTRLTSDVLLRLINAYKNVKPDDPNSVRTETLPVVQVGPNLRVASTLQTNLMLIELQNFTSKTLPTTTTTLASNGPKPSTVTVKVLNRNGGVAGAAAAATAQFAKAGFVAAGNGNSGRAVTRTEIRYKPGAAAKAAVVKTYLGGMGTLLADPTITDHDVTVVIGADFVAVAVPPTATRTTAPPATTAGSTVATTDPPAVVAAQAACLAS